MSFGVYRIYRRIARRPASLCAVVLTVALGIGATSAIFAVMNAVLLRPLPYPAGDRLVAVFESNPSKKVEREAVAPVRVEEWNRLSRSFDGLAGAYTESLAETSGVLPEKLVSARVSERLFTVLGTPMRLGRSFTRDEEKAGGPAAAVISERFWERRFGRDPKVIGKVLRAGRGSYPIVGVAPDSFRFPADDVDVWIEAQFPESFMRVREGRFYTTVGRLKDGVTPTQAQSDLQAVQAGLAKQYPATDAGWTALAEPLKDRTVSAVRSGLWVLFASAALLLAIACTNVASLLLAQASRREREIAVRFSLGAGRTQVVREFLAEAMASALPGAVLGLALAMWGAAWFRHAAHLPRANEIRLDWGVVLFALAATLGTAIVFGLIPAVTATRGPASGSLARAARSQVGGRHTLLRGLVTAQIALAVVLLVGAGLLIRTMSQLGSRPLGFDPEHVLTLHISAGWGETNNRPQVQRRMERTLAALRSMPGVEDAAIAVVPPGSGEDYLGEVSIAGAEPGPKQFADIQSVSSNFFHLLRTPLLSGETCRDAFDEKPPCALINRSFARRLMAGADPLAKMVKTVAGSYRVAGIVADLRDHGFAHEPKPTIYLCGLPGFYPDPAYLVRTAGDPARMVEPVRRVVRALEPNRAVYDAAPLADSLRKTLDERRFQTLLLTLFGVTALTLAMIGLYGLMSFMVALRTREIGLRLALGAQPAQILSHVARQGAVAALAGVAAGSVAALAAARWLESLLFGITPRDPIAFATATLLLLAVAAVATWIPSRRATRLDPMIALRDE